MPLVGVPSAPKRRGSEKHRQNLTTAALHMEEVRKRNEHLLSQAVEMRILLGQAAVLPVCAADRLGSGFLKRPSFSCFSWQAALGPGGLGHGDLGPAFSCGSPSPPGALKGSTF